MSTATLTAPAGRLNEPKRPSLVRLTRVEIRKMTDTRSGRWLLAVIALSAVAVVPVMLFAVPAKDQSLNDMVQIAQIGVQLLLPVLGILSVTAEWSQRTALTTFTLVPDRHRIAAAKMLAGWLLALALTAASTLVAVVGRAAGGALGRSEGSWSLPPEQIGQVLLVGVIAVSMGIAFGMLLMNPALAIVLYFVLPTLWSTVGGLVSKLEKPAQWLDTNRTMEALSQPGVTGGEWARLAVSLAVWLLIPLVAGLVRLHRREVK